MISSEEIPTRRGRGAPPGNLNALKHGFYSKAFRNAELEQVSAINEQDVTQEIELLRLIIKRTVERSAEAQSFDAQLRFLSVLSQATAQLTRLLNIQEAFRDAERNRQHGQEWDEVFESLIRRYRRPFPSHSALPPQPVPSTPAGSPPAVTSQPEDAIPSPSPSAGDQSQPPESSAFRQLPLGAQRSQEQGMQDDKFWPQSTDDRHED